MSQEDSLLRDALVELANLRTRDERLRRTSEAIADALQALGETDDWLHGPSLLLSHLGAALGTEDIALKCFDGSLTDIVGERAGVYLRKALDAPELLTYLARKPLRAVAEPIAVANSLNLALPPDAPGALLSGRIDLSQTRCLLLCCGDKTLLTPDLQDLFRRFLPIFAQVIRRLFDGLRANESEARERAMTVAKEAAEAASRAKSDFVSRMSHELRTPLNAIIGFAQLLEAEQLSPSQASYVQLISHSGDHLLGLINAVLDHAKIEAGRLTLEQAAFDLPACIEAVRAIVADQASAKGLRFEARIAPGLARYILGDATRLRQILINLLANAIKFTQSGKVELQVAEDQGHLHFSIRDTGIGMDANALQRLFKPFSQADVSIERKFGGTGLGLIIARELAQAMGGDIEVESAPGVGTCFWLSLPFQPADAPAPAPVSAASLDATPLANLVSGRVLLVDDNRVNRHLATAILGRLGLANDIAEDGRIACDRVAEQPYALVLMDMEMPVMDGLSATRAIRAAEAAGAYGQRPRLPIIAMTANAMAEDRVRCFEAGMDGYVAKPIVRGSLEDEMRRVLG